jgi:glutathione S-transferase
MIKLYQTSISFNSRRIWITLLEKGLDFEIEEIQLNGQQFQPAFLALNPFHHIPVLIDGDTTIIESLAILDYLESKYPQPQMLPTNSEDLAKVRMVEMVTVNELAPALNPLFPKMLGLGDGDPMQVAESLQKIDTTLRFFESLLDERPFFGSNTITLAEPVAGTVITNLTFAGITLDEYPKLNNWMKRLMLRPHWRSTQATSKQLADLRTLMIERLTQSGH